MISELDPDQTGAAPDATFWVWFVFTSTTYTEPRQSSAPPDPE
jgi:hypothetical protein